MIRLAFATLALIGLMTTPETGKAAVGRTQGSFDVSSTGAATYEIPIWLPRGPNGLQPTLALTYNSQAGNGMMGPGWGLSGLGSVQRCDRTYAQDAAPAAVSLAMTDGYCLNGERLRLLDGTYGAAGSTYLAELTDFVKVTAYDTAGNGPAYFIAQSKDGRFYEYGNSNDARITASGTSTPYQWRLNKVRDRTGNSYIVTYGTGQSGSVGVGVPLSISYVPSSAGSSSYEYSISFAYGIDTAAGTESGYVAGASKVNNNLMTSITLQRGSTVMRRYNLGYELAPTTNRYRLNSVTECPGTAVDSTCLSPTAITYQNGAPGVSSSGNTALSSTTSVKGAYDFNGDGRQDILYVSGTTLYVTFAAVGGYGEPVSTGITLASGDLYDAGDLVASGKDEILVSQNGNWYRYYWNGSAFAGEYSGVARDSGEDLMGLTDINGDGLPDLVTGYTDSAKKMHVFSRLNTFAAGNFSLSASMVSTHVPGTCTNNTCFNMEIRASGTVSDPKNFLDFNGDGMGDIQLKRMTYVHGDLDLPNDIIFTLVSSGSTFSSYQYIQATAFADWNDDQCSDGARSSAILISACNGNAAATISYSGTYLAAMDWNGDGRDDLLVNSDGYVGVYLSTGTGLGSLTVTSIPAPAVAMVFDQNGDGLDDLGYVSTSSPYAVTYRLHEGADTPPDLVTSITDGYGVSYSPTYVSIAQGGYSKESGATYPVKDFQDARYVVNQLAISDGIGGSYTKIYTYTGARQDIQGRGFLGFQSTAVTDSRPSAPKIVAYYKTVFPYSGMVYQQDVFQSDGTTLISRTVNTPSVINLDTTASNQRYFPYVSGTTTDTYEVGGIKNGQLITSSTAAFTYDSYGNLTSFTSTVTDKDSGAPQSPAYNQSWTKVVTHTISPDTSNWCLGVPTQTTVQQYATAASSITRTASFTPDYVNCRMIQQEVEPGSSTHKVSTAYGYDSFGNVNSQTVTGIGMAPRTTTTIWDTTGQFPVSTTNAEGHVTQTGYNYNLGVRTSETNANGLVTSWTHDDFGRKLTETRPDGTSTSWTYNACAEVGGCQNGDPASSSTGINKMVIIETLKDDGGTVLRDTSAYLDQLDRVIVTQSKTLSGGYSRTGVQYDARGQVSRQSAPCDAGNCAVYWTTHTYDALGRMTAASRPISASNSGLQTTTVAYQGLSTVTTDPQGKTKTKSATVTGALARSQDHDGYYQSFGYDAFGSLTSVTDSLSNPLFSASYVYGLKAFQVSANDTDRGATGSTFNALGEVTAITDARGSTFNMTYDALSRPLTRAVSDGSTTTWTWGASAASHHIGQLQSLTSTDGTTENYTYDSRGRLSQRQIISDATYNYDYSYDATGLLDTLTYPTSTSGYRLKLQYVYQNGQLQQIKDDDASTIFWQADAINARGQVTQETLGNGVVTHRAYDAVTGWLNSIQSGVGGGTSLQNNAYLFDQAGNLTQRQDNAQGLTENFYYDNLYRLDYTQLNGVTNLDLSYDALGNIVTKSDVGDYTYHPTKAHRVTGVTGGYTFTYDDNGNATSGLGATVTWNSHNYPTAITVDSGTYSRFWYDANHSRWKQESGYAGSSDTTLYIGGLMEKWLINGFTAYRHYIDAGGSKVVYVRWDSGENEIYYTSKDHLGSTDMVSDASGNPVVRGSFQAFGGRRTTDWSDGYPSGDEYDLYYLTDPRGFTGHEHLDNLDLIHMNGRVYAPWLGKFLSPDPYVTEPGNTQNYNRYSYVHNNPLTYVDPSGFHHCSSGYLETADGCIENVPVPGNRYPEPFWPGYPGPTSPPPDHGPGPGGGGDEPPQEQPGTSLETVKVEARKCWPPSRTFAEDTALRRRALEMRSPGTGHSAPLTQLEFDLAAVDLSIDAAGATLDAARSASLVNYRIGGTHFVRTFDGYWQANRLSVPYRELWDSTDGFAGQGVARLGVRGLGYAGLAMDAWQTYDAASVGRVDEAVFNSIDVGVGVASVLVPELGIGYFIGKVVGGIGLSGPERTSVFDRLNKGC